jgi:hypothetical protein
MGGETNYLVWSPNVVGPGAAPPPLPKLRVQQEVGDIGDSGYSRGQAAIGGTGR